MTTNDADRHNLEQQLLAYVHAENYQPVKPRVIARKLQLDEDTTRELKKLIKRLVKKGSLEYGQKHLVCKPSEKKKKDKSLVTGVFRRNPNGYGFVRPNEALGSSSREFDIFIPARKTLDASNGDIVQVRSKKKHEQGEVRYSGEILEVIERETHQFVGTYKERSGLGIVVVDGNVFAQAIPVGDPGAKNAVENDKVVIEMVRFPSQWHEGEGVIVEVLGARGQPGVDTLSIIREFGLPDDFTEPVLESAREQAEKFDETVGDRVDLTKQTTITIDPFDARDFDDAISLEVLENGHLQLSVHIADVSHFVPTGSPVDVEARNRATSVYLPDRVIPMLPEIISNNLASLQPGRVRYAKTAVIEMLPNGTRISTEVLNTAIQSDRRFTYEEVDQFLEDRAAWQEKVRPEVFGLLERMHELAMTLRQQRLQRGAIELSLAEIKIDLDKQGQVKGAHLVEHTESHQIIEEFMLAANEAVAEMLTDNGIVFLRRVHEPPSPRKLKMLTQFVRELGIPCESLESRFETKRVLEEVLGKPEEQAVNFAVLRSMQKAIYCPREIGHFALNSKNYCHFTSPIRRYPDLTVHRIIDSLARGTQPPDKFAQQMNLGAHCSDREQRAEASERELVKVKLLNFLAKRIGHHMQAVITGVEDYGLFARGIDLPAEGLIHSNSLQEDHYYYDADTHSLIGHKQGNAYRMGDVIQVEIFRVDLDRRELDLRIVQKLKSGGPAKQAKKPSRSTKQRPEKTSRTKKKRRRKRK